MTSTSAPDSLKLKLEVRILINIADSYFNCLCQQIPLFQSFGPVDGSILFC